MLTEAAAISLRWCGRSSGCFGRRRPGRQIDDPLHHRGRQRRLSGLVRLVARQPGDALCHEPRLPRHTTGFDLSERRMISAVL
jgi:hypothetical protein